MPSMYDVLPYQTLARRAPRRSFGRPLPIFPPWALAPVGSPQPEPHRQQRQPVVGRGPATRSGNAARTTRMPGLFDNLFGGQ